MKKRLAAAAILLLISLTLSGCYPSGEVESDNFSVEEFKGTHFEYNKENLTVSFDLPEVPENIPSRIKLRRKYYKPEEIVELFLGGKTVNFTYEDPEINNISYAATDGSSLITYQNTLKFFDRERPEDELDIAVNPASIARKCWDFNRELYCLTEEELDGFPIQDALDRANELISTLGITDLGDPIIYTVSLKTYERCKQFGRNRMFNEKYPLTKDDEVYFIEYPKIFDGGIEIEHFDGYGINKDDYNEWPLGEPNIYVGVARDRIFSFLSEDSYEPGCEILSVEPLQYDLDYALSKLRDFLENTYFGTNKIATINKAKLVYFPVEHNEQGTLEFVPAWCFKGYYDDQRGGPPAPDTDPLYGNYKIAIRADNGDLMEWKWLP